MTTRQGEVYLGDGLYASWDGWEIRLRAPRRHGDHWVGLEPSVWFALMQYYREVTAPPPSPADQDGAQEEAQQ